MIFDAGVFIALEKPSTRRIVLALVEKHLDEGLLPTTTTTALAQAWRDPAKQVALTRLARSVEVFPFGDPQVVGVKCGRSGTSDVVDASLAILAEQLRQTIVTTDPDDMKKLGAPHVTLSP